MSAMPKPTDETKALFRSILPADERVVVKPMFGQLAGFVNGNMFTGVYGDGFFVRPSEADRAALVGEHGAAVFEPMAGRPMKEYVVLPDGWRAEPARLREWVARALEHAAELPEKTAKQPKASKRAS